MFAKATFALLVCATGAAFFVAARLKQEPLVVRPRMTTRLFSPNGDGRQERAAIRFKVTKSDDVTVSLVDREGRVVRHLMRDRHYPANVNIRLIWDGRTDAGPVAADGVYRVRVGLRHRGRNVTLLQDITLDTIAPRPRVYVLGRAPAIFPLRGRSGPIRFRFTGPTVFAPRFYVYRSDAGPSHEVWSFPGRRGTHVSSWDGLIKGRPAPAGTYFIGVVVRDAASNAGTSAPPRLRRPGEEARPGVSVRYLAAQPPLAPVAAGGRVRFFVDARGRRYAWRIRRVGRGARIRARFARRTRQRQSGFFGRALLPLHAPAGPSGVYVLQLQARGRQTSVPFAVQGQGSHSVLVVLPAISWQGLNPVDDDGDGFPNVLPRAVPARVERPFARGLPARWSLNEGPLLVYLDRAGLRYDITTDLALALGLGPRLAGHSGVVLAGEPMWVTNPLALRLERYVERGGRVFQVGAGTLQRRVLLRRGRLLAPSPLFPTDAFGARPEPLTHRSEQLLAFGGDRIGLFAGTDGLFSGFDAFEVTRSLPRGARMLAAAGPQEGEPVILAYRLGKGFVIRTGLPQWGVRLRTDADVSAVTRRAWTLLSH